jgi:membrane protein implicated in regulation of membrane protease activity
MVAPAAASNELVKSVRGIIFSVFIIALVAELAGIATSFVVFVSPSAVAGILAALSYLLALQIKRIRERVHIELDDTNTESENLDETFRESLTVGHEHEHNHDH